MSRSGNLRYLVRDSVEPYDDEKTIDYAPYAPGTDGGSSPVDTSEEHVYNVHSYNSSTEEDANKELYSSILGTKDDESSIVNVTTFRKKTYIHIRKHFRTTDKQGRKKWIPTKRGVCLTSEEFKVLLKNMGAIDHAVRNSVNR